MITWSLVRMLLVDKRPYASVNTDAFTDLFKLVEPRYVIPHRTTIAKHAGRMYAAAEDKLKTYLKDKWQFYPAYTSDLWSDSDGS